MVSSAIVFIISTLLGWDSLLQYTWHNYVKAIVMQTVIPCTRLVE